MHNNNISMAVKKDNFASDVDRLGLAHDIRYVLSTNLDLDKDAKNEYIRKADEKFIRDGKKLPDQINAMVPTKAIQAKLLAENIKVKAGGNRNAGNEKVSSEDVALLEKVLSHLEQMGFGYQESSTLSGSGVQKIAKLINELKEYDKTHNTNIFNDRVKKYVDKVGDLSDLTNKRLEILERYVTTAIALAKADYEHRKAEEEEKAQHGEGVISDAKDYVGNLIAKAAKAYFTRKSGRGDIELDEIKERPLREIQEDKYDNVLKLMSGRGLL